MPNFNYARYATLAKQQIAKFGRSMQLRTVTNTGTSFDPVHTNVDQAITAVQSNFRKVEIDGNHVQANDKLVLCDSDIEPTTEMFLVDGAEVYNIVHVDKIAPGDTVLLYKIQARL